MSIVRNDRVIYSDGGGGEIKRFAWMRVLTVSLTSYKTKRKMIFGGSDVNLDMSVKGYKYMSALKDTCTIKISNLTYKEMISIIQDEYYLVEVKCGYEQGNVFTIFKGGVLYVSNSLSDNKTNECIIICGNEMVARFSQQRLNLNFNSGINLYSALNFVCKMSGVPNAAISDNFKQRFIEDIISANGKTANIIESIADAYDDMIITTDSSDGSTISIFDTITGSPRVIVLNSSTIDLSGGYPQLTSSGLTITIMPTMLFKPTDIIKIDNSILDISVGSQSEISKNYANYLDKDGMYTIYEIEYNLENNGSQFSIGLHCKSKSLLQGVTSKTASEQTNYYGTVYGKNYGKDRVDVIQ